MTSFFGIFNHSGQPIIQADFEALKAVLNDGHHDVCHAWQGSSVALGQYSLHITPESYNEKLPLYHHESGLCLCGDIRLDNRDELFAKLSIPRGRQIEMGDGELILLAYAKWGQACAGHLLGNFGFVVWDEKNQQLFCCTDVFANIPIYYYRDANRFIFATDPAAIAAVGGVITGANYNKMVLFVNPAAYASQGGESWFENIPVLPGATGLLVDSRGQKQDRYFSFAKGKLLRFKNDDDYREAFCDVFFKAVDCRLRSKHPVTALLSGGLDSSAIVSVAAKIMAGRNQQLDVFSAVLADPNDPLLTDERYYIDLFKSVPNININYITAEGKGFFSDLDKLNITTGGPLSTSRHYLYTAFTQKAASLGSRVVLDGAGGELGVTGYADGFYAELFWRFKWARLANEIISRKKLYGQTYKSQLKNRVITPFLPDSIRRLMENKRDVNVGGFGILQAGFAARLQQQAAQLLATSSQAGTGLSIGPVHRTNALANLLSKQGRGGAPALEGPVTTAFPLMDRRLLQFCLDLPDEFKIRDGYTRCPVRLGLAGILPPEIQWRTTKDPFSPDYMRRYLSQLPQATAFLKAIAADDPAREIVDVDTLLNLAQLPVTEAEADLPRIQAAMTRLPAGIYMLHYLRQFKQFGR